MEKGEKMSYEELEKNYVALINENAELKAENAELKKFVNYVRQLKTHADFNRLRNIILATNKQFKP
jgi:cell division septum initiation protein DivIVA